MNPAHSHHRHARRTRIFCLVLLAVICVGGLAPLIRPQSVKSTPVFALEIPDFKLGPSSDPEVTVPYASVNELFVHILKPVADSIDYGAIRTNINGQATSVISEIVAGTQGKTVKISLKRRPGFELVSGRNTVEIWARNIRGREYYASFVINTAIQNWNDEFTYNVFPATSKSTDVPPQILLLEPMRTIELPRGQNEASVKVSGVVSSPRSIIKVTVDGKSVPFEDSEQGNRQLTRTGVTSRSFNFATTTTVTRSTIEVLVEAEDELHNRSRISIPVSNRAPGEVIPIRGKKYALLIGISRYQEPEINDLEYADADARSLYEFLQQPSAGGFSKDDMLLLANEDATLASIQNSLTEFVARASANDLLLIFFAGHGAPDRTAEQNLYVIAHDTQVENMSNTALSMPRLLNYIEQNVRSKRVVMLMDTCHSAGLYATSNRDFTNNLTNQYLENMLYSEEGRAVITSSDVNQRSKESSKWGNGHGVFTYYLLEGLKGNADLNGDHLVSLGELFSYVQAKVLAATYREQKPRMKAGSNENLLLSVAGSK